MNFTNMYLFKVNPKAMFKVNARTAELTTSGKLNRSYNCTIWIEALIQNSAGSDQKPVLDLVSYRVVVWERDLHIQLPLKVQ